MIWTKGDDKYDHISSANDIVIVKLAKPLTFNANVAPACLPAANFLADKKKAIVSGWGMLKWDGSKNDEESKYIQTLFKESHVNNISFIKEFISP